MWAGVAGAIIPAMERISPSLTLTQRGLMCPRGGFGVDPLRPVEVAVITHAHSDHARWGSGTYWCVRECEAILRQRLGPSAAIRSVAWREPVRHGEATVTFHPAGHVRGSAQVRIETADEVAVVTGDYKRNADPTTEPFEVVACDTFVTESTFAMPIYRWQETRETIKEMARWWRENAERGLASILFCYSLGKTQRVLAELWLLAREPGWEWIAELLARQPVLLHGAGGPLVELYREAGVAMAPTRLMRDEAMPRRSRVRDDDTMALEGGSYAAPFAGALAIAPPSAAGSTWMRRFGTSFDTAFASGWMRVRGVRRRRGYDRGFVLSDHADWPDLLRTIAETGAKRVRITHGYSELLSRYLRARGVDACSMAHAFAGEFGEGGGEGGGEGPAGPEGEGGTRDDADAFSESTMDLGAAEVPEEGSRGDGEACDDGQPRGEAGGA